MNLIKQIVKPGEYGTQTIKMIVRSNERGPQGEQGEQGIAATIQAGQAYAVEEGQQAVINTGTSSNAVFDFYLPKGPKGDDGAIKYTAGTGIKITSENVIEATGDTTAAWGGIQGDITDQTDLQQELSTYAKSSDIGNATLTIQNNGTNVATFTANSSTNTTANIVPPVQIGSVLSTPSSVAYVDTANIIDGAVTTSKIDDGAVTTAKFASNAVNSAIKTANDLSPSTDTPAGWANLYGSDGYFVTKYNTASRFANQPTNYGMLETVITGNTVSQRWSANGGSIYYRNGGFNTTTGADRWWASDTEVAFKQIMDDNYLTVIPNTSIAFTNSSAVAAGSPFAFVASKQGRNVFLQGKVDITGSVSAYSNFMSLPDSLRPVTDITVVAGSKQVDIRFSGGVQCHSALTSGDSIMFAASYASK